MIYTNPNQEDAKYKVKSKYANFIGENGLNHKKGTILIIFHQLQVKVMPRYLSLHKKMWI